MDKCREAFEKTPEIAKRISKGVYFNEDLKIYREIKGSCRGATFVNGAWCVWQSRQAEVDELQNRLIAVQRLLDEKFALVYDGKGYFSDMVKYDDLDQALKGSHYEEHHTKAEQQINKGARLTKHQIDLGDKNANS